MVTIRNVAEKAGVSSTTVSMVLNGRQPSGGPISAETQQRVLGAAKELGYRQNTLVRAMISGHNRCLGFLGSSIELEFTVRMMGGVVDEAANAGYEVQVLRLKNNDLDRRVIERCLEMRLAGIITVDMNSDALEYLRSEMQPHSIPIAFLDTSYHKKWGIHVVSDDVMGCRLALEHLYQLGHRRIGFVAGDQGRGMSEVREMAYRNIMREMELEVLPGYVSYGRWHSHIAEQAVLETLGLPQRPTAILCSNDHMAVGVQRAARRLNLTMPEELSLVGFADISVASNIHPALTTVAQPMKEMGEHATRLLLEKINNRETSSSVWDHPTEDVLPVRLVVRESTCPPPN